MPHDAHAELDKSEKEDCVRWLDPERRADRRPRDALDPESRRCCVSNFEKTSSDRASSSIVGDRGDSGGSSGRGDGRGSGGFSKTSEVVADCSCRLPCLA